MKIFDLYNLFSKDPLHQLAFISEILIPGLLLLALFIGLLSWSKSGRWVLGPAILITLGSYLAFILIYVSLPLTNTAYGAAQPVVVVFGVIYLLLLDCGLGFLWLALRFSWLARRRRGLIISYGLGHLLVLSVLFYALYIEPDWLDVTQTQITLAKLPPGTPAIKVALISDIHMERWTRREDAVIENLKTIQPDLIVIAGDHINIDHYEPETYSELHGFFAALAPLAEYGVYTVAGLTERYDLVKLLEGTGVSFIDDSYVSMTIKNVPIYLVGLRSHQAEVDAPVLLNIQKNIPPGTIKMLLYHTPDLAPESAAEGYDFYFAGHTHGGQIALPFYGALFTATKFGRKYTAGLYNLGGPANTRMYVTRGLGMEGFNSPRARLFARPEISVISFVSPALK